MVNEDSTFLPSNSMYHKEYFQNLDLEANVDEIKSM